MRHEGASPGALTAWLEQLNKEECAQYYCFGFSAGVSSGISLNFSVVDAEYS